MTQDASDSRALGAAYAGAHLGKSLFWYAGDLLFVFFLTEFGGLDARAASLALAAALVFSAIADLVVAKVLGRHIRSTAAAGRLQLVGAVACAITFVMFSLTAIVAADQRLAFACVASLAFRAAYALIDVPQNAMLGLAAATDRARARLAGLRIVFSGVASLLVSALAGLLIAGLGQPRAVWSPIAASAALALAATLGAVFLALAASRHVAELAAPGAVSILQVFRSRTVVLPVAMGMVAAASTTLFNKLEPYYAAFALGSPAAATVLLTATALGGVVSQGVWSGLAPRLGPRGLAILAAATTLAGVLIFFALGRVAPQGVALGGFVYGAGAGGLNLVNWTVLAAAARPLGPAATVSAFTFASKLANAAAIIAVGELLARSAYRQTGSEGHWPLLGLMCLAPIVGALAYAGLASRLPRRATG